MGRKINLCFLQIPSFILADRFYPFLGQWHGLMSFKIESNHDGLANTFHLIGFRINDLLNQMKAFGTYLRDGGLYSDVVRCENLLDKIRFDMNNDNANLFPIYSRAYRTEVFSLSQVVKGEVNRVVDVTKFVYIIESQLDR